MSLGPSKAERRCLTCGGIFIKGEKRGGRPYYGYYCEDHDDRDRRV